MRLTTTALAVLAVVTFTSLASAANFQVNYRVDAKALKSGTPAGTPLTFRLYSDSSCTTAAGGSQVVNVENVALIEQPKLIKVKNGPKPPQVAAIQYTITGVTPQLQLYATVTGAGITAVGGACQLQTASVGGGLQRARCGSTRLGRSSGRSTITALAPDPCCWSQWPADLDECSWTRRATSSTWGSSTIKAPTVQAHPC